MNYKNFYTASRKALVEALTSFWLPGRRHEQEYFKWLLTEEEPLLAKPVFQSIFPWRTGEETFEGHANKLKILDEEFVRALAGAEKEYAFPLERKPYLHQTESWKEMLSEKKKTIVVTSGTGSGKTECFMVPVLQDIFRRKEKDCVQAIFLYPLNALMKSQQQRIDAWCRALPGKVTYAIYNGDTEKDKLSISKTAPAFPQLITRPQIRETPPQILFTNPTMLNYMLVRKEDRPILERSQGKLRWILLDEAHTYTGSSAAELSLQLRRVLDAFGVTIDDVNFAVTSATIGDSSDPEAASRLKSFVSRLTGKSFDSIKVIEGDRILPGIEPQTAQNRLMDLNTRFSTHISLKEILHLRKYLNKQPCLDLKDIAKVLTGTSKKSTEEMLDIMDALSEKVEGLGINGKAEALLPTRAHFFVRTINGAYACPNNDCPRHRDKRLPIGSITTIQKTICPECKSRLLEVAVCPHCGELMLQGEESNSEGYRMIQSFIDLDDTLFMDMEDSAEDNQDNDSGNDALNDAPAAYTRFYLSRPTKESLRRGLSIEKRKFDFQHGRIVPAEDNDSPTTTFSQGTMDNSNREACPSCGNTIIKLNHFRISSAFLGRLLSPILLENAEPLGIKDLSLIYDGRKYLTFTDSRQGTARFAMAQNQDVERNWIRSAIFHNLADKRLEGFVPGRGLTPEEQAKYDFYQGLGKTLPPFIQKELEELRQKMDPTREPEAKSYEWSTIKNEILQSTDFDKLYKHLSDARGKALGASKLDRNDYLSSLFLDQFGWIPKRANSMENMGLVKVVYPAISSAKCPIALAREGITDADWKDFLKICIDYVIRGGRHYMITENQYDYLTQNKISKNIYPGNSTYVYKGLPVDKWPTMRMNTAGRPMEKQNRIVLLLCAALGVVDEEEITQEQIDLVEMGLRESWRFISTNILDPTDIDNEGYKLNLGGPKVLLELTTKAWICPVDNVCVDTVFKGYSPRINGYIGANNFNRYRVDKLLSFPYFPFDSKHLDDTKIDDWIDSALKSQCELGIISNIHRNVYRRTPIFIAAEHTAQQDKGTLDTYEKDFMEGRLNILSCSTTMEMGVDIGGVTEVVMNSVPPTSANYLQRAGRAGRRGETRTLALTFCPPSPVGSNTWEHPKWPIDHVTEMPIVKMESRQLIQRHVNALLFSEWVKTCTQGFHLTEKLSDYFDGTPSAFDSFLDFLDGIYYGMVSDSVRASYLHVTRGTAMESITISEGAKSTKYDIEYVKHIYDNRLQSIQEVIDAAMEMSGGQSLLRAASFQKESLQHKTNLLQYLAENNFLPSAGIPTGLVECSLDKKGESPTLHLSQAISSYAPGTQVVKNEWIYEPAGIKLKSRYDANTTRYSLQRCSSCGYASITNGAAKTNCPKCGGEMMGMEIGANHRSRSTEIVEPVGFTTAFGAKPTRKLDDSRPVNFVQPILLEMDPWPRTVHAPKIVMRSSTPRSEIMFYNTGANNQGFVFCPYCGRMDSEPFLGSSRTPLVRHKHLETGVLCEGGNLNALRRNVLLVGRYQTDFVEIKFYDIFNRQVTDTTTLYSLGVIISRKLTEIIGVNSDEVDFGYDKFNHTIFIYDTALGGAGYSLLLREYKDKILDAAYKALSSCNCEKACVNCLIDRRSQFYLNFLERQKALEWLEGEYNSRKAPLSLQAAYPGIAALTTDFESELFRVSRNRDLKSLHLFITGEAETWEPEAFRFHTILSDIKSQGVEVSFVLDATPDTRGMSSEKTSEMLSFLYTHKIETISGTPSGMYNFLMLAQYLDGKNVLYIGEQVDTKLDGHWSNGEIYYAETGSVLSFTPLPYGSIISTLAFGSEDLMFETLLTSNTTNRKIFELLLENHLPEWDKIKKHFSGKDVKIQYTDRYLKSGLDCSILDGMLYGLSEYLEVHVNEIECKVLFEEFGNSGYQTSDYAMIDQVFSQRRDRDEFLKTLLENSFDCEISVISTGFVQHARCITIEAEDRILTIRPDAGVGHGWGIKRPAHIPTINEMYDDLGKEINLFNKQGAYEGILYTVVMRDNIPKLSTATQS